MNISKKRPAMTLLSILASMLVIMIIIVASTPIITKRLQTITTGKAKEGEINLNKSRGYFICYKDTNGDLKSRRVDLAPNQIEGEPQEANNCNFNIPDADEYKVTLIGGGGGGSAVRVSGVAKQPLILYSSSIDFGLNGADFTLPEALSSYRGTISQTIGNANYGVIFSGAKAYDGGPLGAVCRYDITGNESNITFETYSGTKAVGTNDNDVVDSKGQSGIVKVNGKDVVAEAYGGLGMVKNENNMSVAACFGESEGCQSKLTQDGYYIYMQTNNTDGSGICSSGASSVVSEKRGFVDNNNIPVNGIYYQLQKDGVSISRPASGGKAGQVVSNKYTFISNGTELNISDSNIANIGNGGAANSAGGKTTLKLTTATGDIFLSASGGALVSQVDEDIYSDDNGQISKTIEAIDGEAVNYVIPSALNMLNINPGNGGASGGGDLTTDDAMPYACIKDNCNPRLRSDDVNFENTTAPQSGESGAIIIEW